MSVALFSVADKSKLADFAEGLASLGWEFIASGGTAKLLRENEIDVKEVADYTGYPEILGGRVKTLHPAVHGGILSRENETDAADLEKICHSYHPPNGFTVMVCRVNCSIRSPTHYGHSHLGSCNPQCDFFVLARTPR